MQSFHFVFLKSFLILKLTSKAATAVVLLKKLYLKLLGYSQENTCVEALFIKAAGL